MFFASNSNDDNTHTHTFVAYEDKSSEVYKKKKKKKKKKAEVSYLLRILLPIQCCQWLLKLGTFAGAFLLIYA